MRNFRTKTFCHRALSLTLLASASTIPIACADEFTSCEDTLTCESDAGAGGAGSAGEGGDASGTAGESAGGADPGPGPGDACTDEGVTTCDGASARSMLTCTDGAWVQSACAAGTVCAGQPAECVIEGCEQRANGESYCVDDVLLTCSADRRSITEQTCEGRCVIDTCVQPGCGDGEVGNGETCDDGNDVVGDGCSRCRWEPVGVKAMGQHTCAWFADGSLKCWGRNDSGQLGLGDRVDRGSAPGEVWSNLPNVPLSGVTDVGGSLHSTCAIAEGELYCWGRNTNGELARGDTMTDLRPSKVPFSSPRTFVEIEASIDGTFCARPTQGGLLCWGRNDLGQVGRGLGVAAAPAYVSIGDGDDEIETIPSGPLTQPVSAVGLGFDFGCLVSDGTLRCWGGRSILTGTGDTEVYGDTAGETSPPPINLGDFEVMDIVPGAGSANACALSTTGAIKCWGISYSETTTLGYGDFLDQSIDSLATLPPVDLGKSALQLAAGRFFSCAVIDGGDVKCWGRPPGSTEIIGDSVNELGVNLPRRELSAPARVITAGLDHVCALLETAAIACWGDNSRGELGIGAMGSPPPCRAYQLDRVYDPSGSLEGTCCTAASGVEGALSIAPRAEPYQGCKGGADPTRE